MAEDAGAALVADQQQEEQEQQVEAPQAQDPEDEAAGAKKRDRDDEDHTEPDAKRPNTNGEAEDDPPAGEGDDQDDPPAEQADAAAAGAGDDPPVGTDPAADPALAGAAHTDNPGSDDDREYTTYPDGQISEVLHVSKTLVGKLIGKGGSTIMGLQTSTGVSIQVDQATASRGGECRRVTLKGTPTAVESAKAQVQVVLSTETGVPAAGTGEISADLPCPPGIVGRIIGRSGETIKLLQGASGAYILVNQQFPAGQDRMVTVTGTQEAVDRASNMVRDLIADDKVSVQSVIQKYGLGKTIRLQCPRSAVGRIIGRSGETVKMLQRKYNASVQINQGTDPMDVTIIASPHEAEACQAEITHIIANPEMPSGGPGMGPRPGFGGMGPGFGGMGMGMGMMGPRPGFGGMPYGAPFGGMPYGAPYGGYGAGPYGGGGMMPGYGAGPYGGGYGGGAPGYGAGSAGGGYDAAAYGASTAGAGQQQYAGAAAGGAAAGGASGSSVWQAIPDDQGRTYYYNTQTGVSQWEKPADMP